MCLLEIHNNYYLGGVETLGSYTVNLASDLRVGEVYTSTPVKRWPILPFLVGTKFNVLPFLF